jgi:peptidoglycan/xylan/chitin deacetylase (PgdA/CDA1 family)
MLIKSTLRHVSKWSGLKSNFPLNYMVPVYHCVSDKNLAHIKNVINYKTEKEFEQDLDYLAKKFQFVDWDFFKENYTKTSTKPIALLTFDDGLVEFKEIVLPILMRKGIYAVNFINPAFVDSNEIMFRFKTSLLIENFKAENFEIHSSILNYFNVSTFSKKEIILKIQKINFKNKHQLDDLAKILNVDFEDYAKKNKIYMTKEDLYFVKNAGFGIAAHSWGHPLFKDLSLKMQLESARKSLDYMAENDYLSDCFAFPFTDFGLKTEFFELLFQQNKTLNFSFGTAGLKIDSFAKNMQRIPFENGFSAEKELNFEQNYFLLKKILNKNTLHRK